jgi:hypothetical protein
MVAAGVSLRLAVEAGDMAAAKRAAGDRLEAIARLTGQPGHDGLIRFDETGTHAALQLPAVEGLGLPDDRAEDVRVGLALTRATGTHLAAGDAVLAALVGLPLTGVWPAFYAEREQWRINQFRPAMWGARLLEREPPFWQPAALAGLSRDARQLLAFPKLVRRRQVMTEATLSARTLLPAGRLRAALSELAQSELAGVPTLSDRLMVLTAAELKAAHRMLGLPETGTKPRLVEALASASQADVEHLVAQHPVASAGEVTIGLGAGREADWLVAFADLLGHWLTVGLISRAVDVATGSHGWTVLKTDDCPTCRDGPLKVGRQTPQLLPPFHIGCRCCSAPDV